MQNDVISKFLRLVAIDSESLNERGMIDVLKADLADLDAEIFEDDCHTKTGAMQAIYMRLFPVISPKIQSCSALMSIPSSPAMGSKPRLKAIVSSPMVLRSSEPMINPELPRL